MAMIFSTRDLASHDMVALSAETGVAAPSLKISWEAASNFVYVICCEA